MKVYITRWSDKEQKWGKPKAITPKHNSNHLNLPFGYFIGNYTQTELEEYIKQLPALTSLVSTFPNNFELGSIELDW